MALLSESLDFLLLFYAIVITQPVICFLLVLCDMHKVLSLYLIAGCAVPSSPPLPIPPATLAVKELTCFEDTEPWDLRQLIL